MAVIRCHLIVILLGRLEKQKRASRALFCVICTRLACLNPLMSPQWPAIFIFSIKTEPTVLLP